MNDAAIIQLQKTIEPILFVTVPAPIKKTFFAVDHDVANEESKILEFLNFYKYYHHCKIPLHLDAKNKNFFI